MDFTDRGTGGLGKRKGGRRQERRGGPTWFVYDEGDISRSFDLRGMEIYRFGRVTNYTRKSTIRGKTWVKGVEKERR